MENKEKTHGEYIKIYTDGRNTIAQLYDDNAFRKFLGEAVARCHPDDEFDLATGAKLALDRLFARKEARGEFIGFRGLSKDPNHLQLVGVGSEEYSDVWKQLGNAANYFNDKNFANQVALHQLLYRKLLKYAYDNEFEDEEWDGTKMHAYIIYNFTRKDYDIRWTRNEKEPGTVYFKTPTRATAALNEVVMPFVKEYPEFVW